MSDASIVYRFNEEVSPLLDAIGQPLLTNFGITHFGIIKVNTENRMLRIANHSTWNEIYMREMFYNDLELYDMACVPINGKRKRMLTGEPKTKHQKILYEHNLWNFLLLYERTATEGSFFFFGTDRDNVGVMDYYVNYPEVFEHFAQYFIQEMFEYIKMDAKHVIQLNIAPLQNSCPHSEKVYQFYKSTEISKFYIGNEGCNILLSKREAECLFNLIHGKTAKEIARVMNISPRTVESLINNIKLKTGIHSKSALAQKLHSFAPKLNQQIMFLENL